MSLWDDWWKPKTIDEGFEEIPSAKEQDEARKYMMDVLQGGVSAPTRDIAGMSGAETKGMELLNQFLGQPESTERQSALDFLTGILDQSGDVTQLPEIQALMSSIENQTGDLMNSAMRRTQLSGMGTSGPQGSAVGREIAKGRTSMVAALAPYMAHVRGNKLSAADLINSLASSQETSALNKVGAATSYGSLPRTIEQTGYDAEFQKMMIDLQAKYGAAGDLLGETRYMYDPGMIQKAPSDYAYDISNALANWYGASKGGGGAPPTAKTQQGQTWNQQKEAMNNPYYYS